MDSSPDPLLLPPPQGKLLALDAGLARIGVAVCDGLQMTVRPLAIIERRSRNEDFAALAQTAQREDVQALVCGLPLNMDGSEGPQAQTTRRWAMRLAQAMRSLLQRPLPVIFWDERLTTYAAKELMAGEKSSGSAYATDDAVAAAVLLRTYLDATARGEPLRYGRIDLPPRTASSGDANSSEA
jgi:putative Holliday junction resolvase